jgi:hypothetical protein
MQQRHPDFHHLKVTATSQAGHGTVELDGTPIQRGLRGIDLRLHAGEVNAATLELVVPTMDVEGEFEVVLPEETQALLKRLGWTPPA